MADEQPQDQPSGERFIPELMGGQLIEAEHQARYRFALPHVQGKRVLDAGCGSGWGSRLLLEAGAKLVFGIDVADEAIRQSFQRVPEAHFVQADLQDLPFSAAVFDVIVCFETVEHTHDAPRSLDELVRVLAPDGLLFVSSPNPAVYPHGNPFHFSEMTPDELSNAVSSRLRNVTLFRQHLHLSSLIYPEAGHTSELDCSVFTVKTIVPGHDPYSITVGSNGTIPQLRPFQALAPSDSLDHLSALSSALAEDRKVLWADHERIVEERTGLLSERADLHQRLIAAGESLREAMRERDVARSSLHGRLTREKFLEDEAERLCKDIAHATAERDRYALLLVRSEQDLALAKMDVVRSEELVQSSEPQSPRQNQHTRTTGTLPPVIAKVCHVVMARLGNLPPQRGRRQST